VAVIPSIPGGRSLTFNFANGFRGRYVTVVIPGNNRLLTMCEVEVYSYSTPDGENVALGGRATQSSLYEHAYPSLAIDGNLDGAYDHGSCSHTLQDFGPWWRLDLLKRHKVFSITVVNRVDVTSERLKGAEIRIGDSLDNNGNSNPRCGVISLNKADYTFNCNGMEGRYVNIVIPGRSEFLTLCEVKGETQCSTSPALSSNSSSLRELNLSNNELQDSGVELSQKPHYGKATQSVLVVNPWAPLGHAYNAIDGNTDPNYNHGSCTATESQQNPWWRMDLLDEYTVTSITITNRGDCCPERINGAEIHIGNSLLDN
ncbi:hypothetical protein NFI96_009789, partial [Prochilodus magdalenae]